MLYIIAGASLSGKTSSRTFITISRGISGIDTDSLRTMTNVLRPDIEVGHDKDPDTNYKNMRRTVQAFLYARGFFEEDYILEGDGIHLEDIQEIVSSQKAKAVILGYPTDTVDHRLALLKNASPGHWSHSISEQEVRNKIKQCIHYSMFLQQEAKKLGLTFIDVSSVKSIEDTNQLVTDHLFKQ